MAETQQRLEDRRPLSPHLQIYRPTLTMTMSIVHRITGAALYGAFFLLAWYFIAAAAGPEAFVWASWTLTSIPGLIILFGATWALFTHLLGGLRHAIWDTGAAMDEKGREALALATAIGGVALTLLVWFAAFSLR
ncbi:MAG: succinate dehydrogenase, cytochrome b556 subunit [Hyphomicrobiales bacterium]|nr:succinate dehydrogenase, cytochrome b556 subunit [Hyphomicrobiales bacterium]